MLILSYSGYKFLVLDNQSIIFGVLYRPPNAPDSCSSNLEALI